MSFRESLLRFYSSVAPTERGGYRLARFARQARSRQSWRDTFHTPAGLSMDLDLAIYPDVCMAYGLYELTTARLIQRILLPNDHFVDGGANIGYFTMLAAQRVGANGRVDAFEPQPENRARLEANLLRNDLSNRVVVHPLALSDRAGEVEIFSATEAVDNHGTSSLFRDPSWSNEVRSFKVRTVRMDEALASARPKLIKLDIEGSEPLAAGGMTALLAGDQPPSIILEYNRPKAIAAHFAPDEAVRRLLHAQPNYQLFAIEWRLRRVSLEDLKSMEQLNLLLTTQPR